MAQLAQRDQYQPEVRRLAGLLSDPAGVDLFLREFWQVRPDPDDVEFIAAPVHQIRRGLFSGDCDDAATLAACLLLACGWSCTLVAIRMEGATEFSHVYVHAGGIDIDPIVPAELLPLSGVAETIEVSL